MVSARQWYRVRFAPILLVGIVGDDSEVRVLVMPLDCHQAEDHC